VQLRKIDLKLQPKQLTAFVSQATEVLYGGAAGGGKSHLMRVCAISWACAIPGLQIYLFRRVSADLQRNHVDGPSGFRTMLAPMVDAKVCTIIEDEIKFANGSTIYLCHCKDEKHVYKYQGAEIHVLMIDEITHFTESMYRFLRNRVRMVSITVPSQYKGQFPRILCGGNPGNIGHLWVKTTWVDYADEFAIVRTTESEGGMLRQYIPARVQDNKKLLESDPGYINRLKGLGSKALVAAMLKGDWHQVEGAFFDCWDASQHVIRPFQIPPHWLRFRSMDWGSAKPFSVGWWAVVGDSATTGHGHVLMPGDLIRYREWYGMKAGKPNEGLRMTAASVGQKIAELEANETITYGVLDPACFAHNGGPSIYEEIYRGSGAKVSFRAADNTRISGKGAMSGWEQMRSRLLGDCTEDGVVIRPALRVFSNCVDSVRTIPALRHDDKRPEDLDSSMEDHAADDWRYGCASRPYVPTDPRPMAPKFSEELSLDELWKYNQSGRTESRI
jgi:hypothetical protein